MSVSASEQRLQQRFGLSSFHPWQREAIDALLAGPKRLLVGGPPPGRADALGCLLEAPPQGDDLLLELGRLVAELGELPTTPEATSTAIDSPVRRPARPKRCQSPAIEPG